jgi:hypothetical protein
MVGFRDQDGLTRIASGTQFVDEVKSLACRTLLHPKIYRCKPEYMSNLSPSDEGQGACERGDRHRDGGSRKRESWDLKLNPKICQ